ncbi:hypothetical protein WICMUC_003849 [Wickerhamomyces mucosus]|uniref:Amine oxidase n=1 Tax=Wickerhamomyces mucosus TaxID=1378264 RepID=A0A9P8PKF8_9ASCO|nr:hypothetical protein WICMUC_003849 [Wickerhamomyces mucosus]
MNSRVSFIKLNQEIYFKRSRSKYIENTAIMTSPFAPLSAQEIKLASTIIRDGHDSAVRFKTISHYEAPKEQIVNYLEKNGPAPDRKARVYTYSGEGKKYNSIINLTQQKVEKSEIVPEEIQFPMTDYDQKMAEHVCENHPKILAEVAKCKLPKGAKVIADPWCYGTDDPNETRRLFQCYFYVVFSDHPEANHYANPLPFSPVLDGETFELLWISKLPLEEGFADQDAETQPVENFLSNDYHIEAQESVRSDLKPLQIVQEEGPSFTVAPENKVHWQKWDFTVGWNAREGAVLYDVKFDGRPIFYRVSISDMTVPYADPRPPFHRKQAFDLGDVGFGVTANSLGLGCDCLGHIKYFDGWLANAAGDPVLMKNVVCMHEVDNGIQWKHTNYRTPEISSVVRKRELIIQTVATVANYEYIVMLIFDQAANLRIDIRATGILSTAPSKDGIKLPFATRLGPNVQAPYHQHVFSLRLDPAIDGYKGNSVVYEDVVPFEESDNIPDPYGCGFKVNQTTIKKPGFVDEDVQKGRYIKIVNPNKINPVSLKPVGYRLWHITSQPILMKPNSYNVKRAEFGLHPFWVTKYQDDELFVAGEFTNQSQVDTGLGIWSKRDENVENDDPVLWHTFSLTHIPRPEDFPVMPVDMLSLELKPSGFFEKNPCLDVPRSNQKVNKSVLIKDTCCKI